MTAQTVDALEAALRLINMLIATGAYVEPEGATTRRKLADAIAMLKEPVT